MFKCKVVYNVDTEEFESDRPITIGMIRRNEDLKGQLGYGDNVNIMVGGVAQSDESIVPNDAVVVIETAANKKSFNSFHKLVAYLRELAGRMAPARA